MGTRFLVFVNCFHFTKKIGRMFINESNKRGIELNNKTWRKVISKGFKNTKMQYPCKWRDTDIPFFTEFKLKIGKVKVSSYNMQKLLTNKGMCFNSLNISITSLYKSVRRSLTCPAVKKQQQIKTSLSLLLSVLVSLYKGLPRQKCIIGI